MKLVKMLNGLQASIFEKGRAMAFLDRRHKEVGTIDLYMRHRGAPGTGIVVEEDGSAEGNKCRIDFTFLVEFNLPVLPEQDVIHNCCSLDALLDAARARFPRARRTPGGRPARSRRGPRRGPCEP